jgi:hypothetical protein
MLGGNLAKPFNLGAKRAFRLWQNGLVADQEAVMARDEGLEESPRK